MYSSRSFKLSCMDGQVDYPGVQGNVGQTLSYPNEKDSEPSHVNLCLLGTPGCPEFAEGAAFSNNSSLVSNQWKWCESHAKTPRQHRVSKSRWLSVAMPIRRHVGAKQVGRTTATAFLLNSTYQFWNLVPAIFLDWTMMHHTGYHFVELLFCMKRSSRILSINYGSRVVLGLKWFECLQDLQVKTSSFPRATDSEANRVSVFLACKAAPNSRTSSLFRQLLYITLALSLAPSMPVFLIL